ncbi:MAG: hypothetical protein ABIQ95_04910 [Bdellovibrionia bacterium]
MPNEIKSYSVAGKVILLGEYAVLTGLPALVAAIPPRFQLRVGKSRSAEHPKSPIGRLKEWAEKEHWPELSFNFLDPYKGTGGFGASTAQFALAYRAYMEAIKSAGSGGELAEPLNWKSPLALYRQLMSDESLVPSGADLVAQWEGGIVHFNPKALSCSDLSTGFDWSCLLVFSATRLQGRKVPTHEHLERLSKQGFPNGASELLKSLAQITDEGFSAIRGNDPVKFGKALDAYADTLHRADLEVTGAFEDRMALRQLPGVLGVKGAGALLSDALIIVMEPGSSKREDVIIKAQQRGLVLIGNGIQQEAGIKASLG